MRKIKEGGQETFPVSIYSGKNLETPKKKKILKNKTETEILRKNLIEDFGSGILHVLGLLWERLKINNESRFYWVMIEKDLGNSSFKFQLKNSP